MIRINLLPISKMRRQEPLIIQGIVGIIAVVAVIIACHFVSEAKRAEIDEVQALINKKQQEINALRATVEEVARYRKKQETLTKQLQIIRNLEKGRQGPVKMMDEFTELVPRRVFVISFKETNGNVTIEGIGETGPVIADFLDNLKKSKYFSNIELKVVREVQREEVDVQQFTLTMTVQYDI